MPGILRTAQNFRMIVISSKQVRPALVLQIMSLCRFIPVTLLHLCVGGKAANIRGCPHEISVRAACPQLGQ